MKGLRHVCALAACDCQLAVQGIGRHLAPSDSFLKCVLVMNGCCRYFASSTTVVTVNH